jgi:hypothetical protein
MAGTSLPPLPEPQLNHYASCSCTRIPLSFLAARELRTLLESTPNLVALIGVGYIGCPVALPYLPKLKYLAVSSEAVHCDGTAHKDDQTPSLDHVHFGPIRSPTSLVHFLSAWGPKLTSVSLDLRMPVEPTSTTTNEPLQLPANTWKLLPEHFPPRDIYH